MPRIGLRKTAADPRPAGPGEQGSEAWSQRERDALVDRCLDLHAIVAEHGTPAMRRLVDLLLFEIGSEIGKALEDRRAARDLN